MLFDVVIPVLYKSIYTQRTLRTLKRTNEDYRLIIIYNGKVPEEKSWLKKRCDHLIYYNGENKGVYKAWNDGATWGGGDVILWLNDDLLLPEGWLEAFKIVFDKEMMACPSYTRKLDDKEWQENHKKVGDLTLLKWKPCAPPPQFAGYCFGVRRDVFEELGPFDERFRYWAGDADYWRRVRQYDPDKRNPVRTNEIFTIHHYSSRSLVQAPNRWKICKEDNRLYKQKWGLTK